MRFGLAAVALLLTLTLAAGVVLAAPTDNQHAYPALKSQHDQSPIGPPPGVGQYQLLAWSELGMHCIDGKDYSVFSILPPYNIVHAQLIQEGEPPLQITSGVTITYEATTGPQRFDQYHQLDQDQLLELREDAVPGEPSARHRNYRQLGAELDAASASLRQHSLGIGRRMEFPPFPTTTTETSTLTAWRRLSPATRRATCWPPPVSCSRSAMRSPAPSATPPTAIPTPSPARLGEQSRPGQGREVEHSEEAR